MQMGDDRVKLAKNIQEENWGKDDGLKQGSLDISYITVFRNWKSF